MNKIYSIISTVGISLAVIVVLYLCMNILPNSPFQSFLGLSTQSEFYKNVKYAFYFLPLDKIIVTLEAWVLCMIEWYTWRFCYKATEKVMGGSTDLINAALRKK